MNQMLPSVILCADKQNTGFAAFHLNPLHYVTVWLLWKDQQQVHTVYGEEISPHSFAAGILSLQRLVRCYSPLTYLSAVRGLDIPNKEFIR